jgi:hypothetical protein
MANCIMWRMITFFDALFVGLYTELRQGGA